MELEPGQITTREAMKQVFGGGNYSGIEPTKTHVLIYSDPASSREYGYQDGWLPDEADEADEADEGPVFEYTGQGRGNQTFEGPGGSRNSAILNHASDGRPLLVFKAQGLARDQPHLSVSAGSTIKAQRYLGQFRLDPDLPFEWREQALQDGTIRLAIIFRLRPDKDEPHQHSTSDVIPGAAASQGRLLTEDIATSKIIEPETSKKATSTRTTIGEIVAQRREALLCDAYRAFLEGLPRHVGRYSLEVKGLQKPLLTDLYDATAGVLYEAKGTSSREDIRMAIGQLMDYRHHIDDQFPGALQHLAVLLPAKPKADLCGLLASLEIALVYRDGDTFVGGPVG